MKKIFSLIFTFLLCLNSIAAETPTVMAEANRVYPFATENGQVGTTAELLLNMKNRFAICQWECTLALPEGVIFKSAQLFEGDDSRYPQDYNPVLTVTPNNDGSYTFFCEGEEKVALTGTEGTVAIVSVEISNNVTPGTYQVILKSSKLIALSENIYNWTTPEVLDWTIDPGVPVEQGTIHFDLNGADGVYADITQDVGSEVTAPDEPQREGYTFMGWEPAIPAEMPEGEMTCVAQWTPTEYTLIFLFTDDPQGVVLSNAPQAYGTTITPPETPEREGYTFAGWFTNDMSTPTATAVPMPDTMPAHDLTVFAQWTINQYTITFQTGDGSPVDPITQDFGTPVTAPEDPVREGFTFQGWEPSIPETMPAENIVCEAQWTINYHNVIYMIGNDEYARETLAYGSEITLVDEPVAPEGYSFSGWSQVPSTMPDQDVYVSGEYTINSYTLTFLLYEGGPEWESSNLDYGTDVNAFLQELFQDLPEREGYTFTGWGNLPGDGRMPAGDLTIWMEWETNKYTLAFIIDNDIIWTGDVEYGAPIVVPEVPEKEGFVFAGWSNEIPETMPAGEVFIYGSYEAVSEFITLSNQYMTFCSDMSLDFTNSELKAYIATEYLPNINDVVLEPIFEVPAGTGVFLVGEPNETYMIPFAKMQDIPNVEGNLLKGVLQDTYIFPSEDEGVTNYVYGGKQNTLNEDKPFGFYIVWTPNGVVVPAKTAYLQVEFGNAEPVENVRWGIYDKNDPDAINRVMMTAGSDAIFDLQGRRVSNVGKGIYIVGGKKVLMK